METLKITATIIVVLLALTGLLVMVIAFKNSLKKKKDKEMHQRSKEFKSQLRHMNYTPFSIKMKGKKYIVWDFNVFAARKRLKDTLELNKRYNPAVPVVPSDKELTKQWNALTHK